MVGKQKGDTQMTTMMIIIGFLFLIAVNQLMIEVNKLIDLKRASKKNT